MEGQAGGGSSIHYSLHLLAGLLSGSQFLHKEENRVNCLNNLLFSVPTTNYLNIYGGKYGCGLQFEKRYWAFVVYYFFKFEDIHTLSVCNKADSQSIQRPSILFNTKQQTKKKNCSFRLESLRRVQFVSSRLLSGFNAFIPGWFISKSDEMEKTEYVVILTNSSGYIFVYLCRLTLFLLRIIRLMINYPTTVKIFDFSFLLSTRSQWLLSHYNLLVVEHARS